MVVETDASEGADARISFSPDLVFDVLKNRRRRSALLYLRRNDGPVQLPDLAEQVAAWETDTTVEEVSAEDRKKVYTSLYQSHLPKLDDAGILEYDQDRGLVELNPEAIPEMAEYLRDPWGDADGRPAAESAGTRVPWAYVAATLLVVDAGIASFLRTRPFLTIAQAALPVLALGLFVALNYSRTGDEWLAGV